MIAFALTVQTGTRLITVPSVGNTSVLPSSEVFAHALRSKLQEGFQNQRIGAPESIDGEIEANLTDPGTKAIFQAFVRVALHTEERTKALQSLESMAEERPPRRFANTFLGDLHVWRGQDAQALPHFQTEAPFPEATHARAQVVRILLANNERDQLMALIKDPTYELNNTHSLRAIGVHFRDPWLILRSVFLHDYANVPWRVMPFIVFAGLVWMTIMIKICYVPSIRHPAVFLGLIGIPLGVLSTTLTLFAVVWQGEIWGFREDGTPLNDLLYFVSGVGLREEVAKLLCFLPLTPFLYRLRDPKAVLVSASCVGLGFAMQENFGYLGGGGGAGGISRFITANFLHLALTGYLGFAFCRFLYTPGREWERFLATFILVVLTHGIYDYLIVSGGGLFAIFVFAFMAYHFFQLVQEHCPVSPQTVSPLGVFVIGCTLLMGLSLMTTATMLPSFRIVLVMVVSELVMVFPLLFLFINQFRNH